MAEDTMNRKVVVEGTGQSLRQEITIGPFKLLADGPPQYGGVDAGPNPYDYLLTALGACTGQTIAAYAHFNKVPVEHVRVTLTHASIYAEDCKDCDTKKGTIEQLTREIELRGPLSEEQRQALLNAARHSPVSKILTNEIKLETRLVAARGASAGAETGSATPVAST